MVELAHLRILQALHQQGSLAAAADKLCLTQPALSHAIRKLEQHYDVRVWQREGRRLRLTQAGEYLVRMAAQVLPLMDQAGETLQAYGQGKRGKLRIGMECHPCYEWLLTVVEPFLAQWPDVDLDVIQRFRFNGVEALQNHHIDMLITSDPIDDAALINTAVFDYELRLVVGLRHRLASASCVAPGDLKRETLFTFPVARERLDIFTRFLTPAAVEPERQVEMETLEIMLQLAAAGRGVCALPGWLVERIGREYEVTGLPLGAGVFKTLYLVYRNQDSDVDYLQDFVQRGKNS